MIWPTKMRSGFSMPLPAATAAQLDGASVDSVSPGWTTCGQDAGAAPLTSAKPMTPTVATAAAAAARFMEDLSNAFPCVGFGGRARAVRPKTGGAATAHSVGLPPVPGPRFVARVQGE